MERKGKKLSIELSITNATKSDTGRRNSTCHEDLGLGCRELLQRTLGSG